MTREILFRGFCPNENGTQIAVVNGKEYRGDWVEGCYVYDNNLNHHIRAFDICYYAVIPETVCEWTGLTDKNGKKIFEGDIVRFGDSQKMDKKGEIIFSNGAFLPVIKGIGYTTWFIVCEVIGTIFDKER